MAELENDPFAEFGGTEVKTTDVDPFAEFGGKTLKKKSSSVKQPTGTTPSKTGGFQTGNPFNSQSEADFIGKEKTTKILKEVNAEHEALKKKNKQVLNSLSQPTSLPFSGKSATEIARMSPQEFVPQQRAKDEFAKQAYEQSDNISTVESIRNSANNAWVQLQKNVPQLQIATADIFEGMLGKDLAKSIYASDPFNPRDIDQVRLEAYDNLESLNQELKATKGNFADNIKNGNAAGILANSVDAIFNLGATALPAMASGGALTATSVTGQTIADFNEAKAKSKGMTVKELYDTGEAELATPLYIGALATGLEYVGLKGAQKAMLGKLTGSTAKKAAVFAFETNKEGLTELLQQGLDGANKALAEGKSDVDGFVDAVFSKEGINSYLAGTFGSAGAAGVGRIASNVISNPKNKAELDTQVAELQTIQDDLLNPNVAPESKAFLENQARTKINDVTEIVDKDVEATENLSKDDKRIVDQLKKESDGLAIVLNDPNVSEQTKHSADSRLQEIVKESDAIKPIDDKIKEFQAKFPDQVKSVVENIPTNVAKAFERIEADKPVDATTIDEASEWIYDKYKSLTAMKKSDSRLFTIEQINQAQEELGKYIALLEDHKAKYFNVADEVIETPTAIVEETVVEPVVEQKELVLPETPKNEAKPILSKKETIADVKTPVEEKTEQVKDYGYQDINEMADEQEVAKSLNQEIIDPTELSPVQQAIRQYGGINTTEESYSQFGDKNKLTDTARKNFIRKNAQSLDSIAAEISNGGLEVTPADIVDYIDTFAGGENKLSARASALRDKLFDMTGKKFNKYTVKNYVDKINEQARKKFQSQEMLSQEEINLVEQEGITLNNIDAIADKLDWLYDKETFDNIKEYLNGTEQESGKPDEGSPKNERVGEKGDGLEEQPKTETKGESERLVKAKENLKSAKDDFSDFVKKSRGNLGSAADVATFIAKATKLMAAYAEVGIVKLADVIKEMRADYGDEFVDENLDKITDAYENLNKDTTGISKERIDTSRAKLGLDDIERIKKADTELNRQAEEWEKTNSIPDLLKRLEKGTLPTDVENVVLRKYISSLEARNNKNPTVELLGEINRATKVVTEARSELGRALRAGKGEVEVIDNLSNFLLEEMAAMGVENIPQSMIDEIAEKYGKGMEAKEAYEKGYQKAVDEFIKQQAETEIRKQKAKTRPNVKKTDADFAEERKALVSNIREKLKKARSQANAVPVPYLAELIAISPDVAKLVKSYVEQGVSKMDDLVKKIKADLEEDIEGITDKDVRDLIAGEYRGKRPTKNEILADVRELKQQAKLLKQIDDLESGKVPSTETGKIRRSQEIDALKKRVKQLEDETGVTDTRNLKVRNTYLDNQIKKLQEDIELGNFDMENPVPRKIKLDADTKKKQDEYIKFQKETYKRRDAARYEQLSRPRKAWEKFQQFLGLRRLIQTSLDFSMPFRQAITVTLNPRYVKTTYQSFANMFKGWSSEKRYDRVMFAIENDPLYNDMREDKLVFSDIDSKDNLKRDEDYRTSFLYKIPFLREPFLASNRAAAAFINTARYELYLKGVERLRSAGITRDANPEHYTSMANWVMNLTGRGKLLKFMEDSTQAQRVLGDTFYGARLMASRFNLLNPNTYAKMPKEVRVEALKDMASYAGVVAMTLTAMAAAGATVSLDPDEPDFLKARWGDKRYDFATGGMSVYMRFFFKLMKATLQRVNPKIYGENKDKSLKKDYDKYGAHALKNSLNFFRYKLAPNTSYVITGIAGKDALGREFDPSEILNFYPMYYGDLRTALERGDGAASGITILLPNVFGIGMQDYDNKKTSSSKTLSDKEMNEKINEAIKNLDNIK